MTGPLLEVSGLDAHHGHLQALRDVTFAVHPNETIAVIGANGAGKSTLLQVIAGLLPPSRGTVRFSGHELGRMTAHRRTRDGVVLVPEGRQMFASLTVEENLQVARSAKRDGQWDLASIYELFPLLAERRRQRAISLSGGQQQMVAIGRGLMANPALLMLDEVSLGLAPIVVEQVYDTVATIKKSGTPVLVVEQDLNLAVRIADRLVCLLEGRVVLDSPAGTVSRAEVTAAYFGTRETTNTTSPSLLKKYGATWSG